MRKIVVLLFLMMSPIMDAAPQVLEQAFYHSGKKEGSTQSPHHIELGSLVFYFNQNPVMNTLPYADDNNVLVTHSFLFPKVQVKNEILAKVNQEKHPDFQFKMERVKAPVDGIRLSISYNPHKISFKYEHFDSIKLQKGIVFRFFNKNLMDMLRSKGKEVSVIANNTRAPRVVIDCGHGGIDAGARGKKITEKEICLSVGKQLADYLICRGCEVILTRSKDETIELDERTTHANSYPEAALLVSLHANGSLNGNVRGIETFYVDPSLFVSGDKKVCCPVSDIYNHLVHQRYTNGKLLAECVHDGAITQARSMHDQVVDRKVKKAVSQMLLGSYMPATLIELGFITNGAEEALLSSYEYQVALARGIGSGIMRYLETLQRF